MYEYSLRAALSLDVRVVQYHLTFSRMSATFWFSGMPNHPIKTTATKFAPNDGSQEKHRFDEKKVGIRIHPTWRESLNFVFNKPTWNGEMVKWWTSFVHILLKKNQLVLSSPHHQTSLALFYTKNETLKLQGGMVGHERYFWFRTKVTFKILHQGDHEIVPTQTKSISPLQELAFWWSFILYDSLS